MLFAILYLVSLFRMDNSRYTYDTLNGILFGVFVELCVELWIFAAFLNGG